METLKVVEYLWTEIRNLDGILDGIGDFGRTENEILDSMFVQSLVISSTTVIKSVTPYTMS